MEIQLQKSQIPYLQTVKREWQTQEQTQELRLTDGMPDAGSVIGAWGQVILRGKEWENDGMRVNGGTMVWVQYTPEDGSGTQTVECWLPFQLRWSFPQTKYDGTILCQCVLKNVDARITSARKLIVRTNVAVLAQGMGLQLAEVFGPGELPPDICLKEAKYPMCIPVEAGEKDFALEETIPIPNTAVPMEKLLYYRLLPQVTEEKLMNEKLIFRGSALLHAGYLGQDGGQYTCDFSLPFSQYAELDREYDDAASVSFWPCVTALEAELLEGQLHVKLGIVCQYRICRNTMISVVEDVWSPHRQLVPQMGILEIPGVLEQKSQQLHVHLTTPVDGTRLVDASLLPQPVQKLRDEAGTMKVTAHGQFLYCDQTGQLKSAGANWEQSVALPSGQGCSLWENLWLDTVPQTGFLSGSAQLQADLRLDTEAVLTEGIPVVTALEAGELQEPDPKRPSLILKRAGERSLWQLAKETGSTEEAIRQANDLQGEPEPERLLLIPVI